MLGAGIRIFAAGNPLRRSGGGGPALAGGGGGRIPDALQDHGGALFQFLGAEPQGADALAREPGVAAGVVRGLRGVDRSIDFNTELCFGAVEVEDVRPERVLAANVEAELVAAEQGPEGLLRLRQGAAERLCALLGEDRGSHRGL